MQGLGKVDACSLTIASREIVSENQTIDQPQRDNFTAAAGPHQLFSSNQNRESELTTESSSSENKNQRVVCVKNLTQDDVLLHATRLRNALGRKVVKLKTRHVTKHPSVQGTWTTDLKFEA